MNHKSTHETKKIQTRTAALFWHLMRRIEAKNINQFAKWVNDQTRDWGWSDMKDSNKWYRFFKGTVTLEPVGALNLLAPLFPDVHDLYRDGPCSIWSALWGSINEKIAIMRGHPKSLAKEPLEFTLNRIEGDALFGSEPGMAFENFIRQIALYGYLVAVDPYGRTSDGHGFGRAYCAYKALGDYLREPAVILELNALGIREAIGSFFADIELSRVEARPNWVSRIECGEIDQRLRLEVEEDERQRVASWRRWSQIRTGARPPVAIGVDGAKHFASTAACAPPG